MSLLDCLVFDEDEFSLVFDLLHNMFICRTVGDCNSYDTFFEKQCNEQNPDVIHMKNDRHLHQDRHSDQQVS
jgi:hypothetical protein